jgi:hypothetical protein
MFDKTYTVNVNEKERSSVSNCPHRDTFQVKNIRESRFEERWLFDRFKKLMKVHPEKKLCVEMQETTVHGK